MGDEKFDLFAAMKRLVVGEMRLSDIPESAVTQLTSMMKIDADTLQTQFDQRAAREKEAPKPGIVAPGFNLEMIDQQGVRTGETRSLADHRDKPVALLFGSYT